MKRHIGIVAAALIVGSATWLLGAGKTADIPDESLGLAKVSVDAESGLAVKPYSYQGEDPGPGDHNKRIARTYDNQPPMIPHDISNLPIITQEENVCTSCHMPEFAKDIGAIPIPKSHMTNLRKMEDLKGQLYQGRWNCTQCHAPQAKLEPAVMTKFKGAFRKKIGGEYKTNLIDTIFDGVVVKDANASFDVSKDLQEK